MKVGQLSLNGHLVVYTHNPFGNPNASLIGNNKKFYSINPKIYNRIASSAIRQFNEKKNRLTFLTFTFPKPISEKDANTCFSRFLDNFKKTYELNSYIWTKELTEAGRPHFHAICDFPFKPITEINSAWCSAMQMDSKCAVRLPEDGAVVKDMDRLLRYICKYVSKSFKTKYEARCYGISRNILSNPVIITQGGITQYIQNVEHKKICESEHFALFHCQDIKKDQKFIDLLQRMYEHSGLEKQKKDRKKSVNFEINNNINTL